MKDKTISVRFRCGHFEKLTLAEIKKENLDISPTFKINGKDKAESGFYCLKCMGHKS